MECNKGAKKEGSQNWLKARSVQYFFLNTKNILLPRLLGENLPRNDPWVKEMQTFHADVYAMAGSVIATAMWRVESKLTQFKFFVSWQKETLVP